MGVRKRHFSIFYRDVDGKKPLKVVCIIFNCFYSGLYQADLSSFTSLNCSKSGIFAAIKRNVKGKSL